MRHAAAHLSLLLAATAPTGCRSAPPRAEMTVAVRDQLLARVNASETGTGSVSFDREVRIGDQLVVERYRLSNGLKILVLEDHSAPVFAFQTWFSVGSKHEKEGRTGIAHLFEHLLFKESENLGDGIFDRILELNGGRVNASTWVDWTYYRESLPVGTPTLPDDVPALLEPAPADRLELVVRLEADRMAHMVINTEQVEAEREVVKNERRFRVDNDPEGKMYEVLYKTAYTKHPYLWPTIGWMEDIAAISLDDCVAFYRTYYSPNNATVVVVGDVSTERLLTLLRRHYGPLKPQEIPPLAAAEEPAQAAERRAELEMPLSSDKLLAGYHIPAQLHPDHAAVEVANELLFEGRSSRVFRRLVTDEELASEVSGWVAPFADPGILEVMVTLRRGHRAEAAERIVSEEVERLRAKPVAPAELDKAKNRLEASLLRELQSVGGKAAALGHFETTVGDFSRLFSQVDRYRAVSAADVQRVAQVYLAPANRTLVRARPAAVEAPAPPGVVPEPAPAPPAPAETK